MWIFSWQPLLFMSVYIWLSQVWRSIVWACLSASLSSWLCDCITGSLCIDWYLAVSICTRLQSVPSVRWQTHTLQSYMAHFYLPAQTQSGLSLFYYNVSQMTCSGWNSWLNCRFWGQFDTFLLDQFKKCFESSWQLSEGVSSLVWRVKTWVRLYILLRFSTDFKL